MVETFPTHDIRAVANYFIEKQNNEARETEFKLTAPTLEKVILLVYSIHSAFFKQTLSNDVVLLGEYEPYFESLQTALEYTENDEVPELIRTGEITENYFFANDSKNEILTSSFDKNQIKLFDLIWEKLIKFNMKCHNLSFITSNLTQSSHQNGETCKTELHQQLDEVVMTKSVEASFAA